MYEHVESTYAIIAQAYTNEFFDDTADIPFIDLLASALPPGAKLLDLGCGPGQFSQYLANKGFVVQGIDISDEMLTIARAKVADVPFKKMDMRKLDFVDHTFDGVLAAYSIIHIPTPELPGVLAEINRILKPGGQALFITQQGEADHIVDEPLAKGEKVFVNFFSTERLNTLLTAAGFSIIRQGTVEQASVEVLSNKVIFTLVQVPR